MQGQSLMDLILQAGFKGDAAKIMYAIVMAESGGNTTAHNTNSGTGDNSYGLAQINMLGAMGPERLKIYGLSSNDDLFDPLTNLKVAYKMSGGGTKWTDWSTYNTGAYQQYLGQSGATITSSSSGSGGGSPLTAPQGMSKQDYEDALGNLAGLLTSVPELATLLKSAENGGWTQDTFLNKVYQSKWWQTHNDAARELIGLSTADKAEYATRLQNAQNQVTNLAKSMGVTLNSKQLKDLSYQFLVQGWDQQTLANTVGKKYNVHTQAGDMQGLAAQYYQQLKQTYSEFGIPSTDLAMRQRVAQMLAGNTDINTYKQSVIQAAKSMYPGLASQIDAGLSVSQIADPFIQTMANTLELDPNALSISDPLIKKALQGSITQTGDKTSTTTTPLWQFEQQLRTDPRWSKTQNARDTISSALVHIGRDFGFGGF